LIDGRRAGWDEAARKVVDREPARGYPDGFEEYYRGLVAANTRSAAQAAQFNS
jgi:hypothetical protein